MRRIGRLSGRLIRAALLIWAATFLAVWIWTYLWPTERAAPAHGDVIICLGAGQRADDTPGPASRARAEHCASLFHAGAAPVVLFTGAGRGAISTARAMADLAGLPSGAILIEPDARSTLQNALFARDLIPEATQVILVTEAYHLPRSWLSFRAMGFEEMSLAAAARVASPDPAKAVFRESLAIWFNTARYAMWRIAAWLPISDDIRIRLLR